MRATLAVLMIVGLLLLLIAVDKAFADSLPNAYRQRIGNYDVEMTTDPKNPVVGTTPTSILVRIAGVNGDDLVDVPMIIRIVKDGTEIQRTNPIIVPYGHYTHQLAFEEPGRYAVYVDINDYSYSGEILTFTFFINVAGPFDYLYTAAPSAAAVGVVIITTFIFMKKKRNNKKKHAGRTELK